MAHARKIPGTKDSPSSWSNGYRAGFGTTWLIWPLMAFAILFVDWFGDLVEKFLH